MIMKQNVIRFLQKNGVETRFVSIVDDKVYINNLKLSRFSRKKEELFLENFPDFEVRRSKVFQRICTRASRVLKNALSPHDRILLIGPENCVNLTLYAVLEPYTRKYGVELIIPDGGMDEFKEQDRDGKTGYIDAVALPLTLDGEVENILATMLNGKKLDLLSSQSDNNGLKMIYPLINIPLSWIESWVDIEGLNCDFGDKNGLPREMLEFLEGFIPDVREKMMSSAGYLSEKDDSD
jgi:Predicted ATPase of the PP-loop superfamily implicated in cell cycle control